MILWRTKAKPLLAKEPAGGRKAATTLLEASDFKQFRDIMLFIKSAFPLPPTPSYHHRAARSIAPDHPCAHAPSRAPPLACATGAFAAGGRRRRRDPTAQSSWPAWGWIAHRRGGVGPGGVPSWPIAGRGREREGGEGGCERRREGGRRRAAWGAGCGGAGRERKRGREREEEGAENQRCERECGAYECV
jgi:hypothetical protein